MNTKEKGEVVLEKLKEIHSFMIENTKEETLVSNKLMKVAEDINIKTDGEMTRTIMNYYHSIFKDISSNSVLLWKDNSSSYRGESITMGTYGFGIRARRQASPIAGMNDLNTLGNHLEEVVKALNARRKWKKAEELEKFFEIIKGYNDDGEITYRKKLDKPIQGVIFGEYSSGIKIIKFGEFVFKLQGQNSCSIYLMEGGNGYSERSYLPSRITRDDDEPGFNSYPGILNNALMSEMVDDIIKDLKEKFKVITESQQKVIKELDKEFGRYVVMRNL